MEFALVTFAVLAPPVVLLWWAYNHGRFAATLIALIAISALGLAFGVLVIAEDYNGGGGAMDCGNTCSTFQEITVYAFFYGGIALAALLITALIATVARAASRRQGDGAAPR